MVKKNIKKYGFETQGIKVWLTWKVDNYILFGL